MAVSALNFERNVQPTELFKLMCTHGSLQCDQWGITVDEHGAWLTNPYGVDCMLFQDVNEESAKKILNYMHAGVNILDEWAHL